ncbi:MAG: UDP-glucose/GDP-mannose dehydrogenase family protein [Zavarzinella sp.]|nr:UDP-glucose/GDP-mannose dehydrogenase family protein [Zavarzinella sp.]
MQRVAVFGVGYVGCVTAGCLSQDGHEVWGVDIDPAKVAEVNAGIPPVSEPGLDEIVRAQTAAGRLRATTDAREAVARTDVALIAVGTPSAEDGSVTADGVERVVRSIGEAVRAAGRPYLVVVRSTLLPGILEDRLRPAFEAAAGRPVGPGLGICNNPEFLREGSAVKDYYNPPYVLVGVNDPADGPAVTGLYESVRAEKIVTDTRTAALVKYACNAFHAVKVAFANEVGSLARAFGANGHEVMAVVCRDTKLNVSPAYLRPGFAFGGSCLPKDLRALTRFAEQQALRVNLLGSVLPSNESHLKRALKQIRETGERWIGMVGLSFKAGTDDLRESPMVELAETLVGSGCELKIYDANVMFSRLRGRNLAYIDRHLPHLASLLVPQPSMVLDHAGLLLLCTDVANEFDWAGRFKGPVIDLRKDLAQPRIDSVVRQ